MQLDLNLITNLEVEGIDFADYPDFVDSYAVGGQYGDRDLTDEELDYINDMHYELVQETAYNSLH